MVNATGHEKDRFTVMLACTADGVKLPAFVVLKIKTMPKDKFSASVLFVCSREVDRRGTGPGMGTHGL